MSRLKKENRGLWKEENRDVALRKKSGHLIIEWDTMHESVWMVHWVIWHQIDKPLSPPRPPAPSVSHHLTQETKHRSKWFQWRFHRSVMFSEAMMLTSETLTNDGFISNDSLIIQFMVWKYFVIELEPWNNLALREFWFFAKVVSRFRFFWKLSGSFDFFLKVGRHFWFFRKVRGLFDFRDNIPVLSI